MKYSECRRRVHDIEGRGPYCTDLFIPFIFKKPDIQADGKNRQNEIDENVIGMAVNQGSDKHQADYRKNHTIPV